MRRIHTLLAVVVVLGGCGGDDAAPTFNEAAVKAAIESSGRFETESEMDDALAMFRRVCIDTPDTSINEFSVHDLLLNSDSYPVEFIATARLGCPEKFARVQSMFDRGECFGGALAGCDAD